MAKCQPAWCRPCASPPEPWRFLQETTNKFSVLPLEYTKKFCSKLSAIRAHSFFGCLLHNGCRHIKIYTVHVHVYKCKCIVICLYFCEQFHMHVFIHVSSTGIQLNTLTGCITLPHSYIELTWEKVFHLNIIEFSLISSKNLNVFIIQYYIKLQQNTDFHLEANLYFHTCTCTWIITCMFC